MAKEFKVFFSWQSDLSANQTTRFIEESIELAKTLLPDSIILVPDEATRNRLGTPDIMNSIFEKIDDCDLFIADVSIVGQYSIPVEDGEDPIVKYLPNPNVILELGYAAARLTWDRCICLANTKFGAVAQLPFDLNHRRITDFCYDGSTRKQKMAEIAEIIKETVMAYIDKPIAKVGFSHHIVGGYNFANAIVENRIIPYNEITLATYSQKTQSIIENAKHLIERISRIQLPEKSVVIEDDDFDALTENMTVADIFKDPVLSKKFSQKMSKAHDVVIEKDFVSARVKKHLDVELSDDFYYLGNLKETTPMFSYNSLVLEGSDAEKEKYNLICDLKHLLMIIELREMFKSMFDEVLIVPLAIKNLSTKLDERISISLEVVQGTPILPTSDFFDPDYKGLEEFVYDEHLAKELLCLPENSDIQHDCSVPQDIMPYRPSFEIPTLDAFGRMSTPASNEDDYEEELQEFIQDVDEGTEREYSFAIGALRPNETLWLDKVLLIKPVDGKIILEYSLKSNNTTGHIAGRLCYEHAEV